MNLNKRKALLWDLGFLDYLKACEIQLGTHRKRVKGEIPDVLLLVEHPPVITSGKSGNPKNLLVSVDELRDKGISFYQVGRGGDITYHGPGQLVGYPIFSIKDGLTGIRPFICGLEQALIFALRELGIEAQQKSGYTGVWIGDNKIAAIGVAFKRWVTFHGFALNVSANLSPFRFINPCGLTNKGITSIEKVLGRKVKLDEVKNKVKLGFEKTFNLTFVDNENHEWALIHTK